jgi:hypothetical protein
LDRRGAINRVAFTSMPNEAIWRACSQPMSCTSPAWRKSGRAVSVITENTTARPDEGKAVVRDFKKALGDIGCEGSQALGDLS